MAHPRYSHPPAADCRIPTCVAAPLPSWISSAIVVRSLQQNTLPPHGVQVTSHTFLASTCAPWYRESTKACRATKGVWKSSFGQKRRRRKKGRYKEKQRHSCKGSSPPEATAGNDYPLRAPESPPFNLSLPYPVFQPWSSLAVRPYI